MAPATLKPRCELLIPLFASPRLWYQLQVTPSAVELLFVLDRVLQHTKHSEPASERHLTINNGKAQRSASLDEREGIVQENCG